MKRVRRYVEIMNGVRGRIQSKFAGAVADNGPCQRRFQARNGNRWWCQGQRDVGRLCLSIISSSLDQKFGEKTFQPCWDDSHIRGQPWHYRDAGQGPREV